RHIEHDGAMLNVGAIERSRQVFGDGFGAAQRLETCAGGGNQRPLVYVLRVLAVGYRGVTHKQHHGSARLGSLDQGGDGVRQAGTVGNGRHTHLSGHARPALCHKHSTAFMNGRHVAPVAVTAETVDDVYATVSEYPE